MKMRVAVLLSSGRHPLSGRMRGAAFDKRALELALRLGDVSAVHVGPQQTELRLDDYLAMGLPSLDHIVLGEEFDVVPALIDWLRARTFDLILGGTRSETDARSGLVPYLVAHALTMPIIADIASCQIEGTLLNAEQAAARGARRLLRTSLPAIATLGEAGPLFRPSRYRHRKIGKVKVIAASTRTIWYPEQQPEAVVPIYHPIESCQPARDRIAALRGFSASKGRVLTDLSPDSAASEIISFLRERALLPSWSSATEETKS